MSNEKNETLEAIFKRIEADEFPVNQVEIDKLDDQIKSEFQAENEVLRRNLANLGQEAIGNQQTRLIERKNGCQQMLNQKRAEIAEQDQAIGQMETAFRSLDAHTVKFIGRKGWTNLFTNGVIESIVGGLRPLLGNCKKNDMTLKDRKTSINTFNERLNEKITEHSDILNQHRGLVPIVRQIATLLNQMSGGKFSIFNTASQTLVGNLKEASESAVQSQKGGPASPSSK